MSWDCKFFVPQGWGDSSWMGIDLLGGVLINVIDYLVKHLRVDMEMKMEWNGNGMKWVTRGFVDWLSIHKNLV